MKESNKIKIFIRPLHNSTKNNNIQNKIYIYIYISENTYHKIYIFLENEREQQHLPTLLINRRKLSLYLCIQKKSYVSQDIETYIILLCIKEVLHFLRKEVLHFLRKGGVHFL